MLIPLSWASRCLPRRSRLSRSPAGAIVVAAASYNLIMRIYAYDFGDRHTGTQALVLLAVLVLLGLLSLFP